MTPFFLYNNLPHQLQAHSLLHFQIKCLLYTSIRAQNPFACPNEMFKVTFLQAIYPLKRASTANKYLLQHITLLSCCKTENSIFGMLISDCIS